MTKKIMTLDVETNKAKEVFDIGILVADTHGNELFHRQYITKRNFAKPLYFEHHRALYNKRIADDDEPTYLVTEKIAIIQLGRIIKHFNIKEVHAYNADFDTRKIAELAEVEKMDNPIENLQIECLWTWACQTLFQQKRFTKFCIENDLLTAKGNYRTNAETAYAYINNKPEFEEEHTGLEDCKIEYQIYLACKKQKKFRLKGIIGNPWILVLTDEQLKKLPKQFRTMKININTEIERAKKLVRQLEKPLKIEVI